MNAELKPSEVVFDFVIEHAKKLPVAQRVAVYEATANLLRGQDVLAGQLAALAERLQSIEQQTLELQLQFRRGAYNRSKQINA